MSTHSPHWPHTQRQVVAAQMSESTPVNRERGVSDRRSTSPPFFFVILVGDAIYPGGTALRSTFSYRQMDLRTLLVSTLCAVRDVRRYLRPPHFSLCTRCEPMIDRSRWVNSFPELRLLYFRHRILAPCPWVELYSSSGKCKLRPRVSSSQGSHPGCRR